MRKKIKSIVRSLLSGNMEIKKLSKNVDDSNFLMARVINQGFESRSDQIIKDIHKAEYKVFSQFGDAGIIQFLINYLNIRNTRFIEFGVADYFESNTICEAKSIS